jgi:hypothetical protein
MGLLHEEGSCGVSKLALFSASANLAARRFSVNTQVDGRQRGSIAPSLGVRPVMLLVDPEEVMEPYVVLLDTTVCNVSFVGLLFRTPGVSAVAVATEPFN